MDIQVISIFHLDESIQIIVLCGVFVYTYRHILHVVWLGFLEPTFCFSPPSTTAINQVAMHLIGLRCVSTCWKKRVLRYGTHHDVIEGSIGDTIQLFVDISQYEHVGAYFSIGRSSMYYLCLPLTSRKGQGIIMRNYWLWLLNLFRSFAGYLYR